MDIDFSIVEETSLTGKQRKDKKRLQALCFGDIDPREIEEDFYNPEIANVLAYLGENLVGWAGIHQAKVEFEDRKVKLGGLGICTHPDWRRRGIATTVSREAMDYLRHKGCDIAFLSIDTARRGSKQLHEKNGFVSLPRKFSWTNKLGIVKESSGGMIAPVCSLELFEQVANGEETLYVGRGYW